MYQKSINRLSIYKIHQDLKDRKGLRHLSNIPKTKLSTSLSKLGDSSFRSDALEILREVNQGVATSKNLDKEVSQLYNSNIKLLPHEFLFLMINSQDRLTVIKEVVNTNQINKDKKKLRFFENSDENLGINIFPLKFDERINKSPYRMMKQHLDKQLAGKNFKFTGGARISRTRALLSRELRESHNLDFSLRKKPSALEENKAL